jgi:hypothetical protein
MRILVILHKVRLTYTHVYFTKITKIINIIDLATLKVFLIVKKYY